MIHVPPAAFLRVPWTVGDARAVQPRERIATRTAHRKLDELRGQLSGANGNILREAEDLTHTWNWQGYVAFHPDMERVVGDGVVLFEFRFLQAAEINRVHPQSRQVLPRWRADFVVHRADRTIARLHPSQRKEAQPVLGQLADYAFFVEEVPAPPLLQERVLAAPQDNLAGLLGAQPPPRGHWHGFSQADSLPWREAQVFLNWYTNKWNQRPHPRGAYYLDITDRRNVFPWWLLAAGQRWGNDFNTVGWRLWAICWLNTAGRPGFHIRLADGRAFTLADGHLQVGEADVSYQ